MNDIISLINNNRWNDAIDKLKGNINEYILDGNNILHLACIRGNKVVINTLLNNKNIGLSIGNKNGDNCLHLLIRNGWDDLSITVATEYHTILVLMNDDGELPIHLAIDRLLILDKLLKIMIKHNYIDQINIIKGKGETLLNDIIIRSINDDAYFNIFKLLIKNKIALDIPKTSPPLHTAIRFKSKDCIEYLINNTNIDLEQKDVKYFKPINVAVGMNDKDTLKILLDHKIDPNYGASENDYIPICVALNNKLFDVVRLLLNYNIDPDIVDRYRNIPLHYALTIEHKLKNKESMNDINTKLIKISNINSLNINNQTPLHLLFKYGLWKRYYDILLGKQFNVDLKSSFVEYVNNDDIYLFTKLIEENRKTNKPMILDLSNNINIPETNKTDFGLFNSDLIHGSIYTLYLLRKYKEVAIPLQIKNDKQYDYDKWLLEAQNIEYDNIANLFKGMIDLYSHLFYELLPYLIIWRSKTLYYIHPKLKYILKKLYDSSKRFILLKVTLIPNSTGTHANIILFDKKDNSIRRFEPYGVTDILDGYFLDDIIIKLFNSIVKDKITYYRPGDYLKRGLFQTISSDSDPNEKKLGDPVGYCLAWCTWYIDTKLSNIDLNISEKELIEKAGEKILKIYTSNNRILDYIRDYARYLDDEKNKIFTEFKINKEFIYDTSYKNINSDKLAKNITDEIIKTQL